MEIFLNTHESTYKTVLTKAVEDGTKNLRTTSFGTSLYDAAVGITSKGTFPIGGGIIDKSTLPIATEAVKADSWKTRWDLMPFEAVEEINKVLEFGANKYEAHNWSKANGFKWTRVFNSTLRHLFAWVRGEDIDPESGLSHLAHAGCNILFLIYFTKNKDRYNQDDRPVR